MQFYYCVAKIKKTKFVYSKAVRLFLIHLLSIKNDMMNWTPYQLLTTLLVVVLNDHLLKLLNSFHYLIKSQCKVKTASLSRKLIVNSVMITIYIAAWFRKVCNICVRNDNCSVFAFRARWCYFIFHNKQMFYQICIVFKRTVLMLKQKEKSSSKDVVCLTL